MSCDNEAFKHSKVTSRFHCKTAFIEKIFVSKVLRSWKYQAVWNKMKKIPSFSVSVCVYVCISVSQFSHSVVSDSLRPHEWLHTRPPCPSPTPGVHSNSHPLSRGCHPAISFSVIPFCTCPQSLPASESFLDTYVFLLTIVTLYVYYFWSFCTSLWVRHRSNCIFFVFLLF